MVHTISAAGFCAIALTACGGHGEESANAPGPVAAAPVDPNGAIDTRSLAPTITVAPVGTEVEAGQVAQFSVVASGTAPLTYRWLLDGLPISNEGSETLRLPTQGMTVGEKHTISVEVSNAYGRAQSGPVGLTVIAATASAPSNPGAVEVLVQANEGAAVSLSESVEAVALVIPPGSLARTTKIRLASEATVISGLPEGIVPLGESIAISGADLSLSPGARLSLPAPEELPEGHVLGVLTLPEAISTVQASVTRPLNAGKSAKGVTIASGQRLEVRCVTASDSLNGDILFGVAAAGKWILAAVLPELCTSYGTFLPEEPTDGTRQILASKPKASGSAADRPMSSNYPCTEKEWRVATVQGLYEVSRHVQCRVDQVDVTMYDHKTGAWIGDLRVEFRLGMHGPSNKLNKKFEASARAYWTSAREPGKGRPSSIPVQVEITCTGASAIYRQCVLKDLNVSPRESAFRGAEEGWSKAVGAEVKPDGANGQANVEVISFASRDYHFVRVGGNINSKADRATASRLSAFSELRCDKGLGGATFQTGGCVFHQHPAVFVLLLDDAKVDESALHIQEAQTAGKSGAYGSSGLKRTWMAGLADLNRAASCSPTDANSSIRQNPSASNKCSATYQAGSGCDCDEYPFASTWQGGYRVPSSARYISAGDNRSAGARLGHFYRQERVLDLTPESSGVNADIIFGDEFWVQIR